MGTYLYVPISVWDCHCVKGADNRSLDNRGSCINRGSISAYRYGCCHRRRRDFRNEGRSGNRRRHRHKGWCSAGRSHRMRANNHFEVVLLNFDLGHTALCHDPTEPFY